MTSLPHGHQVLGLARSLTTIATPDIRIALIAPWFADTAILGPDVRLILSGIGWVSTLRIAASVLHAATDPDYEAVHGCAYAHPDGGEVFRIPKELLDITASERGVEMYEVLRKRIAAEVE